MKVKDIADAIESLAPLRYQEDYDNAGFQVGDPASELKGVLLCTDVTPAVLDEAIAHGYNMVISHHPLIFRGIKKLTGATAVERMVITAVKHDIAVYSAHTNMDNTPHAGVSFMMASKLGLTDVEVLDPRPDDPDHCGSGVVGDIAATTARELIARVKQVFDVPVVRYSGNADTPVSRVALCGGAGSFLIGKALSSGAQMFLTGDMKYHDFQGHESDIVLADMGHYESEQFTKEIFYQIIQQLNPPCPVAYARQERNQVNYL